MLAENVVTSTTDVIPVFAHRTVVRSMLVWAANQDSMSAAHAAIVQWAADNGYDAIAGVRCEIASNVFGNTTTTNLGTHASVTGQTASRYLYTMYGTAIAYEA